MSGRKGEFDPIPLLEFVTTINPEWDTDIARARVLGVADRTIMRWRHEGMRIHFNTADRLALHLGFMPWEIWGWDTYAGAVDEKLEVA